MKLKDLKENQVVQTTAKNDKQFRELLHKEGFKWCDDDSYIECSKFGIDDTTCYHVTRGTFCNVTHAQEEGYQIFKASDFLTQKIKKSELQKRIEVLEKKVADLEEKAKVTIVHTPIWATEPGSVIGKGTIEGEAEKPQFKVGKVYKLDLAMFYCTKIKDGKPYGFGFDYFGNWCEEDGIPFSGNLTEATPEEWLKRLEEEAKKRGFIKGARFNSPNATYNLSFNQQIIEENFEFDSEKRSLRCKTDKNKGGGNVMKDGKWAEIIEEPQYQVGTIGIFWDGDFEEKMSRGNVIFGELDHITENGHFRPKGKSWSWDNFKPIKFD